MKTEEIITDLKNAIEKMPLDQFMILCFILFISGMFVAVIVKNNLFDRKTWIGPDMSDEETRIFYEEKDKKV